MGRVTSYDGDLVIHEPSAGNGKSFCFGSIVPKNNDAPSRFVSYWGKAEYLTLQIGVSDPDMAILKLDLLQTEQLIKMLQLAVDRLKTTGVFEYPTTDIPKPITAPARKPVKDNVASPAKPVYAFLADDDGCDNPFA